MKKNEAISILATSLRPREPKDRARYDEAVKMAVDALNKLERKVHGCEYCCEDSDGYVLSIEKNGHAYIQNGKLALRANGWWGECGIEYCPMCGRKLKGCKHEID